MTKTPRSPKPPTADEIAKMADRGENISRFFARKGKMMPPIQRVNVDFAVPMLNELDDEAGALNISRQAVIKSLLRHALDQQRVSADEAGRSVSNCFERPRVDSCRKSCKMNAGFRTYP